jgi:hypothetical protein
MKLPQEAIDEFRDLYERKFGKRLSDEEIQEEAVHLINLFALSKGMNI